ncbi:hypothetical protein [Dasania marina]|uniref:hypothetical protein n=1 Tax=Dasania marina TaxID=471499 RepID=UPI0030DD1625|tara:strand:+ start:18746 stop:19465 length:720 start_codon:yes stop_codon:yes gene_type:complete
MKDVTARLIMAVWLLAASTAGYTETSIGHSTAAPTYMPARFADGGNSLLDALTITEQDPNFSATAFCEAKATTEGLLKTSQCMVTDWKHMPYKRKVEEALNNFSIEPATINGKPVDVKMKLTVSYFCQQATCRGVVSLNDGQQRDKFGLNYVSPQLIIYKDNAVQFNRVRNYEPGLKFSIEIMVDEKGSPGDIDVLMVSPDYKSWVMAIKRHLPREKYIPGIYNAAYTAMPFLYVFWVD